MYIYIYGEIACCSTTHELAPASAIIAATWSGRCRECSWHKFCKVSTLVYLLYINIYLLYFLFSATWFGSHSMFEKSSFEILFTTMCTNPKP